MLTNSQLDEIEACLEKSPMITFDHDTIRTLLSHIDEMAMLHASDMADLHRRLDQERAEVRRLMEGIKRLMNRIEPGDAET